MSLLRNVAGLALGMALLGAVAVAQNDDIPLGDVARQQPDKKATKKFDEDNFKPAAPAPTPDAKSADSAKPAGGAAEAKPAGDAAEAKAGDKASAAPDDEVKALEKQLAELKEKRDFNSSRIVRLQTSIQNAEGDAKDSLVNSQNAYKEVLEGINAQIPVVEKKLEAARAAQKSSSSEAGEGEEAVQPAESKPEENPPPKSQ